jgi:CPA1 family monovalent cation:H+ antiporter
VVAPRAGDENLGFFEITAVLVTLAALAGYLNHRFIRLPNTIGIMVITLAMSLVVILISSLGLPLESMAEGILDVIDLEETLLHGMLGFLLFAGALHINLNDLARRKWTIAALATVGVFLSTLIVGGLAYLVLDGLGLHTSFLVCLLFGALISPTDPIAVLGIMTRVGAPKSLEVKVAGESLFNDGVGVVVFLAILSLVKDTHDVSPGEIAMLFLEGAVGGAIFGLLIGLLAYWFLKSVDNYQVEALLTLALVFGGFALADAIHVSGPIAMVVAGLFIGNRGRSFAMSDTTRERLDDFWELIDEGLNSVLFALLGIEVLVLPFTPQYLLAGVIAIPAVLLARFVSVTGVVKVLSLRRTFTPGAIRVLIWGGLRGGISVALALSLPDIPARPVIIAMTYIVVVFSIIVQGLTIGPLVRRIVPPGP